MREQRFASTADNVFTQPNKARTYDPLDDVEWYGKTLRWWIEHGLDDAARSILYEHERREERLRREARDA